MPVEPDFDGFSLNEVYNHPWKELLRSIEEKQAAKQSYWILESFSSTLNEWKVDSVYLFEIGTSLSIYKILKRRRDEEQENLENFYKDWDEDEETPRWRKPDIYRVRISKENYGKYVYHIR